MSLDPIADGETDEFAVLRSAQFLRLELVLSVLATATAIYLHVSLDGGPLAFVVIASFGGTALAMWWCLRHLTTGNVIRVVLVATVALWGSTIVIAPLIPFGLPIMSFPMIIPLLIAGPLLDRRRLGWFVAAGAISMGVVAGLALAAGSSELQDRIPESTRDAIIISSFAVRAITISLAAWDASARRDATLVAAAESREALRASRARLVEVGDEQRRALERNLHDGAQQQLVALAMRMRMLSNRRPEISDDVGPLVEQTEDALAELREIAHGIYPPLLERGGLTEALRAAGRRMPQTVEVRSADVGRYPQPVEAAVYYACLEGLQNAAKYAGADASVTIDLRHEGIDLVVTVADDGPGFELDEAADGRGLQNIDDRIAAIGGGLDVRSAPGRGTELRFRVPAEPPAPAVDAPAS